MTAHTLTDPVDRLIVDELDALIAAGRLNAIRQAVVLDDPTGELTAAIAERAASVRVHCDDVLAEQRVAAAGFEVAALDAALFADARLVVLRLPRALAALQEYAELIATHAHPQVRVLGGARIKHMTRSMNDVLAACFTQVQASLGRQKSRVLHAAGPRKVSPQWPRTSRLDVPGGGLTLRWHGAAFAAGRLDAGTALLLQTLTAQPAGFASGQRVIDLGCGTGILASWLAGQGLEVLAVDASAAACRSTTATAAANSRRVQVRRSGDLTFVAAGGIDAVVCNPPFHLGGAKDSTPAFAMISEAARVLRPGGELWLVYNSHLPYLPALRRTVGDTDIVARNRHYLVTRSTRR